MNPSALRLPISGGGPRGGPVRPMSGEPTSALMTGGPSTSPRSPVQTSNSKTTPAGIKMTNFSIAAIMNNSQQQQQQQQQLQRNNERLHSKLEQSLGKA